MIQKNIFEMKPIPMLVRRELKKLTWWLSRKSIPEICWESDVGWLTTFCSLGDQPEYCKVAPKNESNILPKSPAKNPINRRGTWFILFPIGSANKYPVIQKINPINNPPKALAKVPIRDIPPFVPVCTFYKRYLN